MMFMQAGHMLICMCPLRQACAAEPTPTLFSSISSDCALAGRLKRPFRLAAWVAGVVRAFAFFARRILIVRVIFLPLDF